jgi:4'-phosphopantetheinyl transferase
MNECLWPRLKTPLLPAADEVLLLSVPLDVTSERIAQFRGTFAPREQQRADRYATDELRNRWVAGRGLLRELLAAALGGAPGEIGFTYGAHGKPALDPWSAPSPSDGGPPLTFNVSHSRGRGLYALGRGRELGVDLEEMRARKSDGVANRFFAAGESAALRAIDDEQARRRSFFLIWSA